MCLDDNVSHFVPEAELLPCDDASGNMTGHSKSAISLGNKERTSDEAASTSSVSTPAENLVYVVNWLVYVYSYSICVCCIATQPEWRRGG